MWLENQQFALVYYAIYFLIRNTSYTWLYIRRSLPKNQKGLKFQQWLRDILACRAEYVSNFPLMTVLRRFYKHCIAVARKYCMVMQKTFYIAGRLKSKSCTFNTLLASLQPEFSRQIQAESRLYSMCLSLSFLPFWPGPFLIQNTKSGTFFSLGWASALFLQILTFDSICFVGTGSFWIHF